MTNRGCYVKYIYKSRLRRATMNDRMVNVSHIADFGKYLICAEKSTATVEKYVRDVKSFSEFAGNSAVTKEIVMGWKMHLIDSGYAATSVNSMIASINSFLVYMKWEDCRVRSIRLQRQIYCPEEKDLSKEEYMRLLRASDHKPVLKLIMQSICSTGIRVSELAFFTVEGIKSGEITINCKGKIRRILIPSKLRNMLLEYAGKNGIGKGCIFVGKNKRPLSRTYIWAMMKSLCERAGVDPKKVFPHNLRKLFAKTFYFKERDIALLADVLGHTSINTTRIYIMGTGNEHRLKIEKLDLII